jgi:nucleotide-binding universal stress UspA family protein
MNDISRDADVEHVEVLGEGPLLVGVDSSENAQHALSWSAELAERIGKSIVLAHASSPWLGLGMSLPPFDYEEYRKTVERTVANWARDLNGVVQETRLIEDDAAEGLLLLAGEIQPSFLVLGAHPRRHWTPNVLGSTTAKVLHSSSIPVAVVPDSADTEARGRDLIVGVDGSASSLRALRWAAELAAKLDTSVYALCAFPLEAYAEKPRLADDDSDNPVGHTLESLRLLAAQVARESGRTVDSDVVIGHPAERLMHAAREGFALVLGKVGHGSITEVTFGSVGRACATHSTVPVFVVP